MTFNYIILKDTLQDTWLVISILFNFIFWHEEDIDKQDTKSSS